MPWGHRVHPRNKYLAIVTVGSDTLLWGFNRALPLLAAIVNFAVVEHGRVKRKDFRLLESAPAFIFVHYNRASQQNRVPYRLGLGACLKLTIANSIEATYRLARSLGLFRR
jgi:hypothetical protein